MNQNLIELHIDIDRYEVGCNKCSNRFDLCKEVINKWNSINLLSFNLDQHFVCCRVEFKFGDILIEMLKTINFEWFNVTRKDLIDLWQV